MFSYSKISDVEPLSGILEQAAGVDTSARQQRFTDEIGDEEWHAGNDSGSDGRLNTVIAEVRDPLRKLEVKI